MSRKTKQVSALRGKAKIFEAEGEVVQGLLNLANLGRPFGDGNKQTETIEVLEILEKDGKESFGDLLVLPQSTVLSKKYETIKSALPDQSLCYVKIVYKGKAESLDGENSYHDYSVEYAEASIEDFQAWAEHTKDMPVI